MAESRSPGRAADLAAHHMANVPLVHRVRAPGRLSVMSERTDYAEGCVLPVVIDLEIRGLFSARRDSKANMVLLAFGEQDLYWLGEEGKPNPGS